MDLFTTDQLKRVANILDNAGQVTLATIAIPKIFGGKLDSVSSIIYGISGLFVTFLFWWLSLKIERVFTNVR